MTPEDRTPYAEGRLHLQTFTSAYGVTTVRFEHGPLQFSFTSHEHPLTHLEVDPQGRLRLWLQYCRIRLKFDLFSPPDESGYHEQLLQYRTASYSHQDIEEEEDVKITCRPVQEKGYDQPAEIALDSRSSESKPNCMHFHANWVIKLHDFNNSKFMSTKFLFFFKESQQLNEHVRVCIVGTYEGLRTRVV